MSVSSRGPGRLAAQRDALLALARELARTRQGGFLGDALDVVLAGMGATRGVVYSTVGERLEIVADRALPPELRRSIEHLPLSDGTFVAQRAAKGRKPAFDADVATSLAGRVDRRALVVAGWSAIAAAPLVSGRTVLGVLCAADVDLETFAADGLAFLETAAHVIALGLSAARDGDEDRRDGGRGVKTAQMAALGMLAAGVADELRGPLGALALAVKEQERVVVELRGPEATEAVVQLADLTQEVAVAVTRAREITARLLSAVHEKPPEPVDMGHLAREALARIEPSLKARSIVIDARIDDDCVVAGRREELSQMLVNLLMNGADACETRGHGDPARVGFRRMRLGVRADGARVMVAVEDSGGGVPANVRARIFDPFFTTKKDAVGIGLTLGRQTVLAHHGHIELTSSGLGGALFRIVLPAAAPAAVLRARDAVTTPPKAARVVRGPAPRVAWIDDDDLFLRTMRRAFADWDIRTAQTASEAERMLAAGPLELVFCDVGLPDKSGHLLHEAVRERDPELASRFVFVTGGVITPEVADYLIASGRPTLLKPVKAEEIRALYAGDAAVDSSPVSARTLAEQPTLRPGLAHASPAPPAARTAEAALETGRSRDAATAPATPHAKPRLAGERRNDETTPERRGPTGPRR